METVTNLKEISFGLNKYCGPAVLSALTGKSTDECAAVIGSISGQFEIRAVDMKHLIKAFEKLRFDVTPISVRMRSLYGNLVSLSEQDGCYIITVPHHVIAVEVKGKDIYLIDNHSKAPLPANSSARLMQNVDQIYKVTPKAEPLLLRTEISVERRAYHITITAEDIYKDPSDNTKLAFGRFHFRNEQELSIIIEKLKGQNQ